MPSDPRPPLLTVLGGGGFTFETSVLFRDLAADASFIYLASKWAGIPGTDGLPAGETHPIPEAATIGRSSRVRTAKVFAVTFAKTLSILLRRRVNVVVTIGCSASIPMLIAARVLGRRTVFIESITRGDKLSETGRLVYRLRLAETFVVQWPSLAAQFPRAIVGSLL